jgi:hypothetical protein
MKLKLIIFCMLLSSVFSSPAFAAKVSCTFFSETQISTSGEWLKTDMDFMKLIETFGDGLVLPLDNSLLSNLDTTEVFKAGEVDRGTVYLMGSEMGVMGKLTSVDGEIITIYDGHCEVGFG